MEDGPQPKRQRCQDDDAQSGSPMTLDMLLEERVRSLVAKEIQAHMHGGDTSAQHAAAVSTAIADSNYKDEVKKLKQELDLTTAMVKELQHTIKELKSMLGKGSVAKSTGQRGADESSFQSKELQGSLTLKVGSRKFQTTAATLHNFPESFFGLMASGRVPQKYEKDGSIFIDRNPKHFSFVLDYLRSFGEGFTPPTSSAAQDELRVEADFYGLPGLVMMLRRLHVASHHLMTIGKKGAMLTGNRFSAAVLDVQDTCNFAVTFTMSKLSTNDCSLFVGLAPLDTSLCETWLTGPFSLHSNDVCYPSAIKHGLFLTTEYGGLVSASNGSPKISGEKSCKPCWDDVVESVRVEFHRDGESCRSTFSLVTKLARRQYRRNSHETFKWESDLVEHGLPSAGEYRPMVFFAESASLTINEIIS